MLVLQRLLRSQSRAADVHPSRVKPCACIGRYKQFKSEDKKSTDKSVLWCGHRDLNPDVIDIRPSNVRVCQFRHDRMILWSWWADSNRRPADYESAALPTEPHQQIFIALWLYQTFLQIAMIFCTFWNFVFMRVCFLIFIIIIINI